MQQAFTDPQSTPLAPGQTENGTVEKVEGQQGVELSGDAKALADTKAALTKTQQELAELRKQIGQQKEVSPQLTLKEDEQDEETPATEPAKTPEGKQLQVDDVTDDQVEKVAQIDFTKFQQEFTDTQDVSEEGRNKIADKIKSIFGDNSRQLVDDYIEGAKVRTKNTVDALMETAGGADQFKQISDWARQNLSQEDKIAFNNAVNSNDFAAANLAISGLRMRYEQNVGKSPTLLDGSGRINTGDNTVYKSTAEMRKDMSKPEYKTDPAFREQVKQKLLRSDIT